ncbi:MAG TPA: UDP-N-acetylmuramate--L-alanine ligase [Thermoanaerobaculia bacterium]|nr:UDP-N-acetylmuramate--L-alanine ligase [Thermoanaerobaculia bacterium]
MNFDQINHIHFVGIGGIGMSGLAGIVAGEGVAVSGCDLKRSAVTERLEDRGIPVSIGHDPAHLDGVDLLVVTSAVRGHNPEVSTARVRRIRVMKRAELLGEIVNGHRSIGIAGTHGKTTTSAMVACILDEAGLDPTVLIGGVLRNFGTNARRGSGEYLVVEADEYDRTFHYLHPEIAVVTNIEPDHLEYYGSFEAIVEAFGLFLEGIAPGGLVIGCVDDPAVAKLLARPLQRVVRYGLSEPAELRATNVDFSDRGSSFDVPGVGFFRLFVPGEHNVRNALAAIGVARELGIDPATIAAALAKFLGVDRRFQILGDYAGATIVDDYAHHPTEIRATLEAARRAYPGRRLVALFQPHLYSRTRDFAGEFAEALAIADVPIVAPIYAAREQPIEGISARLIADAAPGIEFLDRSNAQIFNEMRRRLRAGDVFITMGAGDVNEIAEMLVRGDGPGEEE